MLKRVILAGSLLAAMLPATALAGGVNQGDETKVLEADNTAVQCDCSTPSEKVEGDMGRWIHGWSSEPIDKVTLKSGNGAEILYQYFDGERFFIKLSKDVSNYVVWTCPDQQEQFQDQ